MQWLFKGTVHIWQLKLHTGEKIDHRCSTVHAGNLFLKNEIKMMNDNATVKAELDAHPAVTRSSEHSTCTALLFQMITETHDIKS